MTPDPAWTRPPRGFTAVHAPEAVDRAVRVARSLPIAVWSAILGTEQPDELRWKVRVESWLAQQDHE